jgi:hypothetical protein
LATTAPPSEPAKSVALLNLQFLNDHEDLEPTTSVERARLALIASLFKAKLEASGRYRFVSIPADAAGKIAAGPEVGACGGCEFGYGKELGADYAAWIVVQKVSDLILNINVYMADVAAKRMAFIHSVDIRGDTDESWSRGITYLVKNYLLPARDGANVERGGASRSPSYANRRQTCIDAHKRWLDASNVSKLASVY